jgi:AraC-like DNA-binding protein
MWSLLVIACIIFQSAVAIFLLNGVRNDDDISKHLRAMLIILLVHLSSKFLLLAVLKNLFLYTHLPTGFSLAYGPLLLVISRSILGRPMRPRSILLHFLPFFVFSPVYVFLVIAGAIGVVARPGIMGYVAWYQWLDLASLYGYPIYVIVLLGGTRTRKATLVRQIANILLVGVSAGWLIYILEHRVNPIAGFDLRLIPYICLSATPIIILRYRLQVSAETPSEVPAAAVALTVTAPEFPEAAIASKAAVAVATSDVGIDTVPEEAEAIPDRDRRYEKSGLDAAKMDEYEAALAIFMRKSKIYLDPDLSLDGLASKMKMSKHHLTQLLNERIMKNFYSFINEYRIGEAIDRLNNPTLQVNILSLAFDCGFNSRSSFNSYFKKITGHTPSAYRKIPFESRPGSNAEVLPAGAGRTGNAGVQATMGRSAVAAGQGSGKRNGSSRFIRDTSPSA